MSGPGRTLRAWDDTRACWVELEIVAGNTGPLPGDICWREIGRDGVLVADPDPGYRGPTYGALRARLVDEQVNLWDDLDHAVRHAQVEPPVVPGHWSIACDNVARRIIYNACLVGPADWAHIQVDLLLGGIYEKVVRVAGLAVPAVDWDKVRALYDRNKAPLGSTWPGPPIDLSHVHPDWNPL